MHDWVPTSGPHLRLVAMFDLNGRTGHMIGHFQWAWTARSCIGPRGPNRNRRISHCGVK